MIIGDRTPISTPSVKFTRHLPKENGYISQYVIHLNCLHFIPDKSSIHGVVDKIDKSDYIHY